MRAEKRMAEIVFKKMRRRTGGIPAKTWCALWARIDKNTDKIAI